MSGLKYYRRPRPPPPPWLPPPLWPPPLKPPPLLRPLPKLLPELRVLDDDELLLREVETDELRVLDELDELRVLDVPEGVPLMRVVEFTVVPAAEERRVDTPVEGVVTTEPGRAEEAVPIVLPGRRLLMVVLPGREGMRLPAVAWVVPVP